MAYVFHILVMLNIYIILVLSLNLPSGMSNLLTLCQAAFYGIGAYIGTFLLLRFNYSFLFIVAVVVLINGLFSLIISFASIKLKGDYFVMATLGFQMIVYSILYNAVDLTNGPFGLSGIPSIRLIGGHSISSVTEFLLLTLLVVFATVGVSFILGKSPFGRALKAFRSTELPMVALGRNPVVYKAWTFFFSAAFAGIAGVLYASYSTYIDPTIFTLDVSLFLVSALFVGGTGNVKGPILGAVFVVLFPEVLRFIGLPEGIASSLRMVVYGIALLLIVFFRPQGLMGENIAS